MLKSSGAMAGATLFSRVLGMVREMVYAQFMGTTWVASAFQFAFQVPNLFRRLLGEGALTAAFIPIFKQKENTHGEDRDVARGQRGDLRAGHCRRVVVAVGMVAVSGALLFGWRMDGATQFAGKTAADAAAAAPDVSLHAAGVPGGGVHRHAQCARPFFHPGDGRDDAQRGDDRVRALAGAADGTGISEGRPAAAPDFRAGHRRAGGGRGAGGVSVADALARRLPLPLGFAVAQ